jgi:virulence-associated protein VagC
LLYKHSHHRPIISARGLKSGHSQAILLPKAWRLATTTVQIEETGRRMLIFDPKVEAKRLKALSRLHGSCSDFPSVEPLPLSEP